MHYSSGQARVAEDFCCSRFVCLGSLESKVRRRGCLTESLVEERYSANPTTSVEMPATIVNANSGPFACICCVVDIADMLIEKIKKVLADPVKKQREQILVMMVVVRSNDGE